MADQTQEPGAPWANSRCYAAIFLISLVTLMFEILLTRICSVVMWYHFAFMVISVAMFGVTAGPVLIYLMPRWFPPKETRYWLWWSSLLFSILILVASYVLMLVGKATPDQTQSYVITYLVFMLPFVASGTCISLALTRFDRQVGQMYAADLLGAAAGCLAIVGALICFGGVGTVFALSAVAGVAALLLAKDVPQPGAVRDTGMWLGFLLLMTVFQYMAPQWHLTGLNFDIWKNKVTGAVLFEKWNHLSCIRVIPAPDMPLGWGLCPALADHKITIPEQNVLQIDVVAATPLTKFNGDFSTLEHLKYDVSNFVHYVRPDSDVAVIGVGGGRDILSALTFKQKSVTGIELNDITLGLLRNDFSDFTGHLDQIPGVNLVLDEGRSYIQRSGKKFDIIQASLIDTWAATSAGAFVLAENSLYTTDAWKIFWDHLSETGIVSVSRWYRRDMRPDEFYRLVCLAYKTLRNEGVSDPGAHIIAVVNTIRPGNKNICDSDQSAVTLLLSKQPFSKDQVDAAVATAARLKLDVLLAPGTTAGPELTALMDSSARDKFIADCPSNLNPPTDDSPFFFNMARFDRCFAPGYWQQLEQRLPNQAAVLSLTTLLGFVSVLTAVVICLPMWWRMKKEKLRTPLPLVWYFASLGLGFMFLEIAMIEKLTLFLGHPIFGLTLVLFCLLLGAGAGSYISRNTKAPTVLAAWRKQAGILISVLLAGYLVFFYGLSSLEWLPMTARIAVAVVLLLPVGSMLGIMLPLGLKIADCLECQDAKPWLWSVNGATSIWCSVVAIIVAMGMGISASYLIGGACYLVAIWCLANLAGTVKASNT